MAIKDNRTLIVPADNENNFLDTGGGATATDDPDVFYYNSPGVGQAWTNGIRSFVYDFGSGTEADLTDKHIFLLVNCGVVGLLQTRALGGFRVRFCAGAAAGSNYFDYYISGSDTWPTAFAGGWVMFVVDCNKAFEAAAAGTFGEENGTGPSISSVRCLGIAGECSVKPTKAALNTWLDGIWELPYGNPGLIIEGLNSGADYTFVDVLDYDLTNSLGIFRSGPGGSFVSSTPIQIGNNTTSSTHGFSDTNKLLLFDTQITSNTDFYSIETVNTSGSTLNVTAGVKTGTGENATGAQGWTIQAAEFANTTTYADRWNLIANTSTANVNFYGCTFVHSNIIRTESANTEVISSFLIDGNEYVQSTSAGSSIYLRNTVVNANTADGEAYLKTVDLDNIDYSTFEFSDGHAIEITTTSGDLNETSNENIFTGYSTTANTTDAAIYNNSGNDVTIGQTGGDLNINSYRNQPGTTTTITSSFVFTITNIVDSSEVRLIRVSDSAELAGIETVSTTSSGINDMSTPIVDPNNAGRFETTYTHDGTNTPIRVVVMSDPVLSPARYQYLSVPFPLENKTQSLQVAQVIDRVYSNP
jgi:hypothetical protein